MSRRKRILITGADGFIGSALGKFISQRHFPYEVIGISRRREAGTKIIRCNLSDPQKTFNTLAALKPDSIFHCAGGRGTDEQKIWQSNFETTRVLLESIRKIKNYRPRIVIMGSAAEYGPLPAGVKFATEKLLVQPNSWYGFVKYMQTSLGLMYFRKGLDITVVRLFNILGEGVPASLVIGKFAQEVALIEKGKKSPCLMTANLSGKRDFLDIEDVCAGLIMVARAGRCGEIYNLCSGRSYVIGDLLKKLTGLSCVKGIVIKQEKNFSSESYETIGSNRKVNRALHWKSQVTIEESLRNSLEYYRSKVTCGS